MSAERVQLRRAKGWRKPEGAVVVARPSKWGNPFKVGEPIMADSPLFSYVGAGNAPLGQWLSITPYVAHAVVDSFAKWIVEQPALMLSLDELRGHDLACWCPLDQPCHADVLLDLANAEMSG